MSSLAKVEALLGRLADEDGIRVSRSLGYAYLRVVEIDGPDGELLDALVRDIDPLARTAHLPSDT